MNTAIIDPYLKHPYNGRIHQKICNRKKNQKLQLIQSYQTNRLCSSWQDPRTEDLVCRGQKCWSRVANCWCWLYETILSVQLNQTDSSLCPYGVEGIRIDSLKGISLSQATLLVVGIFSKSIFPLTMQSQKKRYLTLMCFEAMCWTDFLTELQHPSYHCYRQMKPSRSWLAETCEPTDRAIRPLLPHQTSLCI